VEEYGRQIVLQYRTKRPKNLIEKDSLLLLVSYMVLKDETALSIGMISLAIGILLGRFTDFEYLGFSISAFVEGILIGLSLVMNLFYLVRRSRK
jgi:hypothetical protein